jgi:hypothetical protein
MTTHLSNLSCYQCAGELGWFLDELQGRWYTVSWLLDEIMEPAAIPSHPQQRRGGGTHEGSMAPSPTHQRATRPSPGSASPPSPARPAPSYPQRSMGGSREGLMAPSPADHGATKPSTSLATPSVPASLTTTPTCPSQGSSSTLPPSTTTGGGATAAEHRATTTLFCWVRRTWLRRWFDQHQRKHLQTLCRGTSAYAASVRGDCQPPPTLTDKTSDPKVLRHSFRDCGQPLPQRRRARQTNRPCCHPGRRHWPRAPDSEYSGGGPQCMPLCFWAAQTMAAALELHRAGTVGSNSTAYIPPHMAATTIQLAYQFYVHCIKR